MNTPIPPAEQILSPANITDLVEIANFGGGILYDYYLTDDQKTLVAVFSNAIRFFDTQTLEQSGAFPVSLPEMYTTSPIPYSISKDASTMAVLGDQQIQVWRISDGELIQTIKLDMDKGIRDGRLELSADGQYLYAVLNPQFRTRVGLNEERIDKSAVWSVEDGSTIVSSEPVQYFDSVFSPDGTLVVINDGQFSSPQFSKTKVYRLSDGEIVHILTESFYDEALRFSPDGKFVAHCINGVLSIYQISDWSEVDNIPLKHGCDSSRLSFDSTSQYIITSSYKAPLTMMVYRLSDKSKSRITTTPEYISYMDLSPDGVNLLAHLWGAYGSSYQITLWNPLHQKLLASQKRWDYVAKYRFSQDGSVASFPGETADTVQLLNSQDGSTMATLQGKWPLFLPDGQSVLTWNGTGFSRWDIDGGNSIGSYPIEGLQLPPMGISAIEFSPDGELFSVSAGPATITAFDVENLKPAQSIEGSGVAFSRNGKVMAVSNGSTVTLTSVEDGSLLGEIKLKGQNVNNIALSPNGDFLAVSEYLGSAKFRLSLWAVADGEELKSYNQYLRQLA